MKISAIISTYNRARFLPSLFDSLKSQTLTANNYEVIIINNNSTDKTEQLSQSFVNNNQGINIKYFEETNQGLSFARNRGIKEAAGELVTFIDDDAIPAEDFLEKTVMFFDEHPEAEAAGGKIFLRFLESKPAWYNRFLSPLLGYFSYGETTRIFKTNYFRGSNMTFRKSLFSQFEPFNTNLGRTGEILTGGEEKELFYRLKRSDVQLWYNAEAIVYHLVPAERTTLEFIKKQAFGTGKSKKVHALIEGKHVLFNEYLAEVFTWMAALVVSFYYLTTFRFSKGLMIIIFRYQVSKGLFSTNI